MQARAVNLGEKKKKKLRCMQIISIKT